MTGAVAGSGDTKVTTQVRVLAASFVVFLAVVMVAEYYMVHYIDENNTNFDSSPEVDLLALPPGWIFASATSAYQVEGAWNHSDKGMSIWDTYSHKYMTSNGDDACKSVELFKTDVQMIVKTGFNAYRFSISWPRVLPYGVNNYTSSEGISYYNRLIDELLAYNITPLITLYHWDLPQALEDMGGWLNPSVADWFQDFADVAFAHFGSKVKWWITFNEPDLIVRGYGGTKHAPGRDDAGISDYIANHNILRAHAKAYHLYNAKYRSEQKGSVGMTFNVPGVFPVNASDPGDLEAANRAWNWNLGLYAHAVYSPEGNYPSIVRELVDSNSQAESRAESRLPHFTPAELQELRGAYDFIGVNHYYSDYVTSGEEGDSPSMARDSAVTAERSYSSSTGGLRPTLNYVKEYYRDPVILITEVGLDTSSEGVDDQSRIALYHSMVKQTLEATYLDGCNVVGFTGWSLMDNFEWGRGYGPKYGIWHVNFTDESRARSMKESTMWFQEMLRTWRLPGATGWKT